VQSQQEQRLVHFNYAFSQARFVDILLIHTNQPCIISMPHMKKCTPTSYVTPLDQRVWLGSKPRASQIIKGQVNIRWMTMQAAPGGILETLTVVVSLDVQQDVVPVKK
jgi:hypothetical protein